MGILTIKYDDLTRYKSVNGKLRLIYDDYAKKHGIVSGKITSMVVFGFKLRIKSSYEYYPDNHDSRSIPPTTVNQDIEIDLSGYIED